MPSLSFHAVACVLLTRTLINPIVLFFSILFSSPKHRNPTSPSYVQNQAQSSAGRPSSLQSYDLLYLFHQPVHHRNQAQQSEIDEYENDDDEDDEDDDDCKEEPKIRQRQKLQKVIDTLRGICWSFQRFIEEV